MSMATYIRAVTVSGPTYSPLGVYNHRIRWETNGRSGYIVQHLQRHELYQGPPPWNDERIADDYWEAWRVDNWGGVFPVKGNWHDEFSTSHNVPGAMGHARAAACRGHWRIKGTVYWTSEHRFDQSQWTKNAQGVGGAGILLTRSTRPPYPLGHVYLRRNEAGEWDSTLAAPLQIPHRRRVFGHKI